MKNLITYNKAKEELFLLSNYVHLNRNVRS